MVFRALADLFVVHEILATQIGVYGRHCCFPVVTLVGANKHFLAPLPRKAQIEVYGQSYERNRNWYSLAKQANLALFSIFVDVKTG